jgi:hypothetical protein
MLRDIFGDGHGGIRGVIAVFLFVALAPFLLAQTAGTAALTGKITDAAGAAVPDAKVTVVNADGSQTQTATTGADGVYRFGPLPPGNYSVKIEAAGFQTLEIASTTIPAAGAATVDGNWKPRRSQESLRWGIWDSLRIRPREAPRHRRDSTSGRTCSRSIRRSV